VLVCDEPLNDMPMTMKIPEHITFSYLLAQLGVQQHYGATGTVLMIAAGCLPDLDGLTLVAGWRVYRKYHRVLGHGLPVTLAGPPLLTGLGSGLLGLGPPGPLWLWLQLALVAHLLTDACFYRWPVQVIWPLSSWGIGFGLVTWNDLVPTLILYGATVGTLVSVRHAPIVAGVGIGVFGLYLGWRAWQPRRQNGWAGWLTGEWAEDANPFWRWLTGDFIP
jgi:membrane-bound metal-dependent hydrolase YbcI (DUF457 family)